MKWLFIDLSKNSGKFNMSYDLELAASLPPNTFILRLYQWNPYCISLGKNQSESELNLNRISSDGLEIVQRPTGGRAILHSEEITYSVITNLDVENTPKILYRKISEALSQGLTLYDHRLVETELESIQPNFKEVLNEVSAPVCFASTAKNEVKFSGKKIIGSAQRKLNNTILQHGSILCGTYHKKLVQYLNLSEENIQLILNEMDQKTIEIETVLNEPVDYSRLAISLKNGFENYFNIKFEHYER